MADCFVLNGGIFVFFCHFLRLSNCPHSRYKKEDFTGELLKQCYHLLRDRQAYMERQAAERRHIEDRLQGRHPVSISHLDNCLDSTHAYSSTIEEKLALCYASSYVKFLLLLFSL